MTRTLGVICARGGSKGFPGKNIAYVGGVSILQRSQVQANNSKLLSRWVVSTDNLDYYRYVWENHFLLRPPELATDDARIEGALQHALKYCEEEEGEEYDYICMLLNTHPLRMANDIDRCIEFLADHKDGTAIRSGYWIEHPYELVVRTGNEESMGVISNFSDAYQRQGVNRSVFLGNGAVVVTTRKCLVDEDTLYGSKCFLAGMPMWRSLDVDSPEDLKACEIILRGIESCESVSAEAAVA